MRREHLLNLFFLIFVSTIFILGVFFSLRDSAQLAPGRYRIPDTDVTIQIPVGFEARTPSFLYISQDLYKIFATPIALHKVFEFKAFVPDPYRGYQTPETIVQNFFGGEPPEKQIINEFEVYLIREEIESHPQTFSLKGLIVYKENQFISLAVRGPVTETFSLYALIEAILSSLQIGNPG